MLAELSPSSEWLTIGFDILERSSKVAYLRDRPIGSEMYKLGKREFLSFIQALEDHPELPDKDRVTISANIILALDGEAPTSSSSTGKTNKSMAKGIGGKMLSYLGTALEKATPASSSAQSKETSLLAQYKDDAVFLHNLPRLANADTCLVEPASRLAALALESIKQTQAELERVSLDVLRKWYLDSAKRQCRGERARHEQVLELQGARQYFEWLNTFNTPGRVMSSWVHLHQYMYRKSDAESSRRSLHLKSIKQDRSGVYYAVERGEFLPLFAIELTQRADLLVSYEETWQTDPCIAYHLRSMGINENDLVSSLAQPSNRAQTW